MLKQPTHLRCIQSLLQPLHLSVFSFQGTLQLRHTLGGGLSL
jgi:hypothetical protein